MSDPVCSTEERIITLDFDWNLESDLKDFPRPLFLARIVKRSLQRITHKLLSKLEGLANHVHFLEAGAPVDSLLLPCECSWEFPTSVPYRSSPCALATWSPLPVNSRAGCVYARTKPVTNRPRLATSQSYTYTYTYTYTYIYIYIYIYTQRQPNKKTALLGGTRHPFFLGGGPLWSPAAPGAWTFKLRDHGMQIGTAESYLVRRGRGRACQETLEMSRMTWPQ